MLVKFEFSVDPKNIGYQNIDEYKCSTIVQKEQLVSKMRWKLFHALQELKKKRINGPDNLQGSQIEQLDRILQENSDFDNNYGFKSTKNAPPNSLLTGFEEEFFGDTAKLQTRKFSNDVQEQIKNDLSKLKSINKVLIKSDKTNNWYTIEVTDYKRELRNAITTDYRLLDDSEVEKINKEAAYLANQLGISDRIDKMSLETAFITVKDHKSDFPAKYNFRLINPAKSQMGRVSKVILERVNKEIRRKLGLNQWQSSNEALEWFHRIPQHDSKEMKFIQCDITNFYPSISENLMKKALVWAANYTYLSELAIEVIMHSRRTVLFDGKHTWCKRDNPKFDIGQGSFDGAESSELIGLFMIDQVVNVHEVLPKDHFGLYRDDILGVDSGGGPKIERDKKKIVKIFKDLGLHITTEATTRRVHFLDFVLDLDKKIHKPFQKPNSNIVYVNQKSNHPPKVLANIPKGVENRLVKLSSNKECFDEEKGAFQKALNVAGYRYSLSMDNERGAIGLESKLTQNIHFSSQNNCDLVQSTIQFLH